MKLPDYLVKPTSQMINMAVPFNGQRVFECSDQTFRVWFRDDKIICVVRSLFRIVFSNTRPTLFNIGPWKIVGGYYLVYKDRWEDGGLAATPLHRMWYDLDHGRLHLHGRTTMNDVDEFFLVNQILFADHFKK